MNPQDLLESTEYKRTAKVSRLYFVDTHELIVEWNNVIAPTTHLEACEQALSLSRERHAS